jgi:large subunit ribosomal protein L3
MPKAHHPHRGSLAYWPRKRNRHSLVRVRSWTKESKPKPLGFICFKAGMTHLLVVDNRPKGLTKGQNISMPVTILDCPPMTAVGIAFYKMTSIGPKKVSTVFTSKLDVVVARKMPVSKKAGKKIEDVHEFDDVRLLVHSNPKLTSNGAKKPKLIEIALGGSKDEKINYAKEVLGKEIKISDVFTQGNAVDVRGTSKGKGFQGTVKRYGVPVRQHKAEKTKRGIGNLGAWTPKRVDFTIAQSGKMGYHQRTEYNKQIIQIGEDGKTITPKGGLTQYGIVKNNYIFIKGGVVGSRNREVMLTAAIRPNKKITKDAPEVSYISK